jgi:hypothetical protein
VVLPTPPFWFAQAMILPKCFPTRNLTNVLYTCKLFHVECEYSIERFVPALSRFEPIVGVPTFDRLIFTESLFHVKQTDTSPFEPVLPAKCLFHVKQELALGGLRRAKPFRGEDLIVGGSTFGGSFRRFTCYLHDFWPRMGVPRETKCIVLFLTKATNSPLLTHIY